MAAKNFSEKMKKPPKNRAVYHFLSLSNNLSTTKINHIPIGAIHFYTLCFQKYQHNIYTNSFITINKSMIGYQ